MSAAANPCVLYPNSQSKFLFCAGKLVVKSPEFFTSVLNVFFESAKN
jgi:hypothetical protein